MVQIAILHPEGGFGRFFPPGDSGLIENGHVPGVEQRYVQLFGIGPGAEPPEVPKIRDPPVREISSGSLGRNAVVVLQIGTPEYEDPDLRLGISTQDLFNFRRRLKTVPSGGRVDEHESGGFLVLIEYLLERLTLEVHGCHLDFGQVL